MLFVLFVTALQISSIFGATLSETVSALTQKIMVKQMATIPKKTASKGLVTGADYTLPQNLYIYQYGNQDCLGDARIVSGKLFNVCLNGMDKNGQAFIGSGISQIVDQQDPYTFSYYREFNAEYCSGTPTYEEEQNYGNMCFVPSDTTFSSTIRATFSNVTDPTKVLAGGVIFTYYDNLQHCSDKSYPSSFTYVRFGECFPTDDGSVVYSNCSNGNVNVVVYSDNQCSQVSVKGGIDLAICERYYAGTDEETTYRYNNYISYFCV